VKSVEKGVERRWEEVRRAELRWEEMNKKLKTVEKR